MTHDALNHEADTVQSQTCLPLPIGNTFLSLFHPLVHPVPSAAMCPTYDDRWDLRTHALGCHVNTLTVFASFITVLCTLVGLVMLWGFVRVGAWMGTTFDTTSHGWQIETGDDGARREGVWRRNTGWRLLRWVTKKKKKRRDSGTVQERRWLMEEHE